VSDQFDDRLGGLLGLASGHPYHPTADQLLAGLTRARTRRRRIRAAAAAAAVLALAAGAVVTVGRVRDGGADPAAAEPRCPASPEVITLGANSADGYLVGFRPVKAVLCAYGNRGGPDRDEWYVTEQVSLSPRQVLELADILNVLGPIVETAPGQRLCPGDYAPPHIIVFAGRDGATTTIRVETRGCRDVGDGVRTRTLSARLFYWIEALVGG